MKVHKEIIAKEIGSALKIQANLHKLLCQNYDLSNHFKKVEQKQSNWNTPNTGCKTHPPQSVVRLSKECKFT